MLPRYEDDGDVGDDGEGEELVLGPPGNVEDEVVAGVRAAEGGAEAEAVSRVSLGGEGDSLMETLGRRCGLAGTAMGSATDETKRRDIPREQYE